MGLLLFNTVMQYPLNEKVHRCFLPPSQSLILLLVTLSRWISNLLWSPRIFPVISVGPEFLLRKMNFRVGKEENICYWSISLDWGILNSKNQKKGQKESMSINSVRVHRVIKRFFNGMFWIFLFYCVKMVVQLCQCPQCGFILVLGRSSPVEEGGSSQPLWILWGSSKNRDGISPHSWVLKLLQNWVLWLSWCSAPAAPQEDVWEAGGCCCGGWQLRSTLCHHCCIRPTSHHPISWGLMEKLPQTHPLPLQRCQGTEISTMIQ